MDLNVHSLDGNLLNWLEVSGEQDWDGILLGNGASLVMWDKFLYGSLFETARDTNVEHRLTLKDREFFTKFGTKNFEEILDRLSTTETCNSILGISPGKALAHHANIQLALFEAVYHVHPPDGLKDLNIRALQEVRRILRSHSFVFSTNYDLLVYWAMMSQYGGAGFVDFFWNEGLYFDPANVDVWHSVTRVLYLHGGIHLARMAGGRTLKRCCTWEDGTLQQSLWTPRDDGAIPLFITEGTSRDKERAIGRSEYLNFALDEFKKYRKPLVIFGHSLSASDNHLVNAIQSWGDVPLAFSMRPARPIDVRAKKASLRSQFPEAQIYVFDSTSHPLGAENLKLRTLESVFSIENLFAASRRSLTTDNDDNAAEVG